MEVSYRGKTVGQIQVEVQDNGVRFVAECRVQTNDILRLYGLRDGCAPLRIDVAEPVGDSLRVQRTLSWYALRTAGYTADSLPTRYVLDAGDGSGLAESRPAVTGDVKLDALIMSGVVRCQPEDGGFCIQAPFAAGQACPLAFALTACTVAAGQAVLHVYRKSVPFQAERQMIE